MCLTLIAHHWLRIIAGVLNRPGLFAAPGRRPSFPLGQSPRGGAPSGAHRVRTLRRGRQARPAGRAPLGAPQRLFSIPGRAFQDGTAILISQLLAGRP